MSNNRSKKEKPGQLPVEEDFPRDRIRRDRNRGNRRKNGQTGNDGHGNSGDRPSSRITNKNKKIYVHENKKKAPNSTKLGSNPSQFRARCINSTTNNAGKKNGEKGAKSHTVAESSRIELSHILASFHEDDSTESIELPPNLTTTERKFVHEEARRLGLISKSHGKGEERKVTLLKYHAKKGKGIEETKDCDLPKLELGDIGKTYLLKHIENFPISADKDNDSNSSNSSNNILKSNSFKKYRPKYKIPTIPFNNTRKKRKKNKHNSDLPIQSFQESILSIINSNPITILTGDTGCGKSTQLPQFILSSNPQANIVVTQPRRISAISLADRISWELSEEVGNTVGYSIRMDSVSSSDRTRIMFVTPGILLQKLDTLNQFTHIILDEIHERDQYTEFLMMSLRQKMEQHTLKETKLILMSATMPDRQQLIDYWNAVSRVGEISVPGRMFPVQEFFLENILEMIKWKGENWQQEKDMQQLDNDLAHLFGNDHSQRYGTGGSSNGYGLVCVMCQRKGFTSAEELGTHVALCTGDLTDVVDLEERVRNMKPINELTSNQKTTKSTKLTLEHYETYFHDVDDYDNDDDNDDDNDLNELNNEEENLEKWDGNSPFFIMDSGTISSPKSLIQEQLLSQYQELNDDEQVDEMLLLALLQFLIHSSFGDGAILIFFAGWNEIISFHMLLKGSPPFCNDRNKFKILPLHSGVSTREQKKVFEQVHKGVRKIVLATNIAETSVTIDDVSFVVDTGRAKEKNYDPHLKSSTLQPVWISKASAKQRKGRAGRTKAGVCLRLYSRRRFSSFRPNLESELLRTPLEQIALQCKKLYLAPGCESSSNGIRAFLAKAVTPPHPKSVTNAIELLVLIGAMYPETNDLTNLGKCLSQLSLEPRVGKMVLWSHILGCARDASSMAVAMSYKSPFVLPTSPSMRRNAQSKMVSLSNKSESDLVMILYALRAHDNGVHRRGNGTFAAFCNANFLNLGTMQMISDLRRNISRELETIGFPSSNDNTQYHNRFNGSDPALLEAGIIAGLYPNVAMRRRGDVNFITHSNLKAKIHVSSVNACDGQRLREKCSVKKLDVELVAYNEMVKGVSGFTMSQTTRLSNPLPLLLLCGDALDIRPFSEMEQNEVLNERVVISLDNWIQFQCLSNVASNLIVLRKRLERAFSLLIQNPASGFNSLSPLEVDAVNTACTLLRGMYLGK